MNCKIKIAGIITLVSIFLLAVTACEDAEVGPNNLQLYLCERRGGHGQDNNRKRTTVQNV